MAFAIHPFLVVLLLLVCVISGYSNSLKFRPLSSATVDGEDCPAPCTCNETGREVECTDQGRKLNYIPKLPTWTEKLVFARNSLHTLNSTTFSNVSKTNLTDLQLPENNIRRIASGTFLGFSNLQTLNLSKNDVNVTDLREALKDIGTLEKLKNVSMHKMKLHHLPGDMWNGLNGSNITMLDLSHNSITNFNGLQSLGRIKELNFIGNALSSFSGESGSAPFLEILRLSYNDFHYVPYVCFNGTSIFPKLALLALNYNNIWYLEPNQINCLDRLHFLDLTGNLIQELKPGFMTGMNALRRVELAYLRTEGNVPRQIISLGNPAHIWRLTMINSGIRVGHDNVSTDLFQGLTSLSELYWGWNFLSQASDDFFLHLLQPLQNLTLLDLSSCEMHRVPKAIAHLPKLERLWLFNNYIVQWPGELFKGLHSLTHLALAANQIAILSSDAFPDYVVEQLTALNLSRNPFACTCDNLFLLEWMRRNASVFKGGLSNYRCRSPASLENHVFPSLTFTQTTCLVDHHTAIMVIVVLSLVLCLVVTAPLVFRYRWHIQSAMFTVRYPTLREEGRRVQREYDFDAFLIYSETDSRRVRQEFLPRLEKDRGLHLCVHERDFWAGKLIVDNIVDCMLASRTVIVLLSNATASSEWCQFMLTLAYAEVLESGAAPLVLLLLEDIVPHNMTPTLYAVLKTTTYLRYPDLPRDAEAFWQHVHRVLADVH